MLCGNDFPARAEGDTVPEPIDELTPSAAVELALTTVARYRRPDLEGRLRQARARLDDGHVRVLVVGEFKQGKSLLVNGLVGAPVCPVRDDVATSVATVVSHAPQPAITLRARVQGPDGRSTVRPVQRTEVPVAAMAEALAGYVTERGNPGNRRGLSRGRGQAAVPTARGRSADRRHAGGRRPPVGARRGDDGRAASGRRRAAGVGRSRPGLHGPRAGVPHRAWSARTWHTCVSQDRPLPGVAAHRRAGPGHLRDAGIEADLIAVSSTLRLAGPGPP